MYSILLILGVLVGVLSEDSEKDVNNYITDDSTEYTDTINETMLMEDVFETDLGDPVQIGGFWKCGNCSDIDDSQLVYSEDNDYADEHQDTAEIEINLSLPNMRCVTVSSDVAGVVRKLTGACEGPAVTLSLSPAGHFVVQVYT